MKRSKSGKHTEKKTREVAELVETDQSLKPAKMKPAKRGWFSQFRRESKRDRQLAALTTGYQELTGLVGSIRDNLEMQTQGQQQLLNALHKMADATDTQTEVMGKMRERLDSGIEQDQQMIESVNRFNETLIHMNKTNRWLNGLKGIVLLLVLSMLAVAIYFSLDDSAKSAMADKFESVFSLPVEDLQEESISECSEPEIAMDVASVEPVVEEEPSPEPEEGPLDETPPEQAETEGLSL